MALKDLFANKPVVDALGEVRSQFPELAGLDDRDLRQTLSDTYPDLASKLATDPAPNIPASPAAKPTPPPPAPPDFAALRAKTGLPAEVPDDVIASVLHPDDLAAAPKVEPTAPAPTFAERAKSFFQSAPDRFEGHFLDRLLSMPEEAAKIPVLPGVSIPGKYGKDATLAGVLELGGFYKGLTGVDLPVDPETIQALKDRQISPKIAQAAGEAAGGMALMVGSGAVLRSAKAGDLVLNALARTPQVARVLAGATTAGLDFGGAEAIQEGIDAAVKGGKPWQEAATNVGKDLLTGLGFGGVEAGLAGKFVHPAYDAIAQSAGLTAYGYSAALLRGADHASAAIAGLTAGLYALLGAKDATEAQKVGAFKTAVNNVDISARTEAAARGYNAEDQDAIAAAAKGKFTDFVNRIHGEDVPLQNWDKISADVHAEMAKVFDSIKPTGAPDMRLVEAAPAAGEPTAGNPEPPQPPAAPIPGNPAPVTETSDLTKISPDARAYLQASFPEAIKTLGLDSLPVPADVLERETTAAARQVKDQIAAGVHPDVAQRQALLGLIHTLYGQSGLGNVPRGTISPGEAVPPVPALPGTATPPAKTPEPDAGETPEPRATSLDQEPFQLAYADFKAVYGEGRPESEIKQDYRQTIRDAIEAGRTVPDANVEAMRKIKAPPKLKLDAQGVPVLPDNQVVQTVEGPNGPEQHTHRDVMNEAIALQQEEKNLREFETPPSSQFLESIGKMRWTKDTAALGDLQDLPSYIRAKFFTTHFTASTMDERATELGVTEKEILNAISDYAKQERRGRLSNLGELYEVAKHNLAYYAQNPEAVRENRAKYGVKEQPALFGAGQSDISQRFEALVRQYRANGLSTGQALAAARKALGSSVQAVPNSPAAKQLELGSSGGVESFGRGREGETELFEPRAGYRVTETPAFKKWFGDSKVVDAEGKPLVVYHGSGAAGITEFDPKKSGSVLYSDWGPGIYFTPSKWMADGYREGAVEKFDPAVRKAWDDYEAAAKEMGTGTMHGWLDLQAKKITQEQYDKLGEFDKKWRAALENVRKVGGGDVYPSYVSLQNPMDYTYGGIADPFLASLAKSKGHDGIIIRNEGGHIDEIVAFRPEQIKSAIGNRGTFDPKDSNITRELTRNFNARLYEPEPGVQQLSLDLHVDPSFAPREKTIAMPVHPVPAESRGVVTTADGSKIDIFTAPWALEFRQKGFLAVPNHKITSPADLAFVFKTLHDLQRESFYIAAMKGGRILSVELVAVGTVGEVQIYPREILSHLIRANADSFVMMHNHPSGFTEPSEEDLSLTKFLKTLAVKAGIKFEGHVIIDDTKFGFIDPDNVVGQYKHKNFAKTQSVPLLEKFAEWKNGATMADLHKRPTLNTAKDIFELFKGIQAKPGETMVAFVNVQNVVLKAEIIPVGALTPQWALRETERARAFAIFTANSGLTTDRRLEIKALLKTAGMNYYDDLMAHADGFTSAYVKGMLEDSEPYGAPAELAEQPFALHEGPPSDDYERARNLPEPVKDTLPQFVAQKRASIKQFGKALLESMSGRLKDIDPSLKVALRKFESDYRLAIKRDIDRVKPFLDGVRKIEKEDPGDARVLDLAMKNGRTDIVNGILRRHGVDPKDIYDFLSQMRRRIQAVGYDVGYVDGYFPRKIRDKKGFERFMTAQKEIGGEIQNAIRDKSDELGRELTDEERVNLINSFIRGFVRSKIALARTGNMKTREIDRITPELSQYYFSSREALVRYIAEVNEAIEARKFFGRIVERPNFDRAAEEALAQLPISEQRQSMMSANNIQDSIGAFVNRLLEAKKITADQQQDLVDLFRARFGYIGTHGILGLYKNIAYMDTITSPISALSVLEHLGITAYRALWETPGAFFRALANRSKITLQDIGFNVLEEEVSEMTKSAFALKAFLNASGFSAMERITAEAHINAVIDHYRNALNRGGSPRLDQTLIDTFGPEADNVVDDLKAGRKSQNVLFLATNELLDVQPRALSEMPQVYLESPGARLFYSLKTFMVKRLNFYREEVFDAPDKLEALKRFVKLTMMLMIVGAGVDEIKDFILRRKTSFSDRVIDNLLKPYGISKFMLYHARERGPLSVVADTLTPPHKLLDSIWQDVQHAGEPVKVKGGRTEPRMLEITASIPVGGKLWYWWLGRGAQKMREQDARNLERRSAGWTKSEVEAGRRDPRHLPRKPPRRFNLF